LFFLHKVCLPFLICAMKTQQACDKTRDILFAVLYAFLWVRLYIIHYVKCFNFWYYYFFL